MENFIISLDQGTTSSRALLIDKDCKIRNFSQKEIRQYYPKPGWVEEDPMEIYTSQVEVFKDITRGININSVLSVGITNQRETVILWDKNSGEPVYNAIVWQCRRGEEFCQSLTDRHRELIHNKTGLFLNPYFSGSKLSWMFNNIPGLRERAERGELLFGTVDTWLLWNLTGRKSHYTDFTNASRTLLFNINTLSWDEELLEIFNIPKSILPIVKDNSDDYGRIKEDIVGREIDVNALIGDQQSALFGQLCTEKGDVKNTYGTGCFALMNIGEKPLLSKNGLLTTIGLKVGDSINYAFEGSVFIAGGIIKWLRDELGLLKDAIESEEMARKVEDTNGLTFVSTFQGVGTPYWKNGITGEISGLTMGCNKFHIVRSALESIAFRSLEVISTMESDSGILINSLKVDGGASKNNFLMEFQSDIINSRIVRPENIETTAMGAAYLAGIHCGFWTLKDLKNNYKEGRDFLPTMTKEDRNRNINRWQKAIHKVMT